MDDAPSARAARRLPVFALLSASAVSEFGNVLTFVAVPWFVLETTGSAARTGLTGGAVTLAVVLAGLLGGPVVDRLGFKRTSVLADLTSGATVGAIPLLYHTVGLAFWQLLALVFLGALLDAPGLTARQSIVPDLAAMGGIRTERVNSAMQAIGQFALLLGPPVAGVLIAVLTPSSVLFLDAATFAVSAAAIAALVPSPARRLARRRSPHAQPREGDQRRQEQGGRQREGGAVAGIPRREAPYHRSQHPPEGVARAHDAHHGGLPALPVELDRLRGRSCERFESICPQNPPYPQFLPHSLLRQIGLPKPKLRGYPQALLLFL